ncbi:ComF family protein [Dysosmobacter sp.]|uniref:ComF family protein n=1 Tax=Dysosmobacter sp. TaxID=2591382 RepID=UPI002A9A1C8D|nr:phosphoribosyltransferase family protein [Dysosmobacter sp.]MCI6053791.1 double zinc ribbon domain-containing protein [Dysosmobacter sp.]MDY5510406.1 phosphoribosyltransferase family protein [Dysosmobacter sp.]
MKLLDAALDLLYPPKCPFCGKVQETRGICPACCKALPWTEGDQGLKTLPGGTVCAAPLWYEDLAREGLLRFKFQGAAAAAEPLGELIAQCAAERFSGAFDVVTWVPVSRRRLRKRGYDQARLLAESACRVWGVRPERLLRKTLDNPAQSGLHEAAARRANVLGVYEAADPDKLRGRRVLLVDDICTTGATLAECARTLRAAGAESVACVTAALTREKEKVHNPAKE